MHTLVGPIDLIGPMRTKHPEEGQTVLENISATSPLKGTPLKFLFCHYCANSGAPVASLA